MPNDDENAAEPLLNLRAEIGHLARMFLDGHDDSAPASATTESWAKQNNNPYHNEMVREANESFRIADEKKRMTAARKTSQHPAKQRSTARGY